MYIMLYNSTTHMHTPHAHNSLVMHSVEAVLLVTSVMVTLDVGNCFSTTELDLVSSVELFALLAANLRDL